MKLRLPIILVLCAVVAVIGTWVRPGIPEIAIVLGVTLGAYYWRNIKRSEHNQVSDPNVVSY